MLEDFITTLAGNTNQSRYIKILYLIIAMMVNIADADKGLLDLSYFLTFYSSILLKFFYF